MRLGERAISARKSATTRIREWMNLMNPQTARLIFLTSRFKTSVASSIVAGAVLTDDGLGLPAGLRSSQPAQLGHFAGGILDEHRVDPAGWGSAELAMPYNLPEVLVGKSRRPKRRRCEPPRRG
jgi:hypothetical protein